MIYKNIFEFNFLLYVNRFYVNHLFSLLKFFVNDELFLFIFPVSVSYKLHLCNKEYTLHNMH